MKRIKHTEEQIIRVLKRFEAGEKAADLAREVGITLPTFYNWKAKFGGMEVYDAKKLRALEEENRRQNTPRKSSILPARNAVGVISTAV
jgi:putative transposase